MSENNTAPVLYITHEPRGDGFGAQFQTIMFTVMFAEFQGFKYIYSPFKNMEHNYDNDPDFLEKKESLINFRTKEPQDPDDPWDTFTERDRSFPVGSKENPYILRLQSSIAFFNGNPEKCLHSKSLQQIRERFNIGKDCQKYSDQIAVHVRRPNQHDNRIEGTNAPNTLFINAIKKIKNNHTDLQVHIYSQGSEESFTDYVENDSNTVLHLNESVEDTFTALALSPVVLISQSSFSYSAGFINTGTVYYFNFDDAVYQTPLPSWILLS
jgi:hypothetical protein